MLALRLQWGESPQIPALFHRVECVPLLSEVTVPLKKSPSLGARSNPINNRVVTSDRPNRHRLDFYNRHPASKMLLESSSILLLTIGRSRFGVLTGPVPLADLICDRKQL